MRPLVLLAVALFAFPAFAKHGDKPKHAEKHQKHAEKHDWPAAHGVPPGHLPPAGSCRIWYPGVPPGHQPPPTSCAVAYREAPRGAWVIDARTHAGTHVRAYVPRPDRPDGHAYTLVFDLGGAFVRVEWD
ncbi:MAG: hypothetical protein V4850_12065 [Myxococcota bacterium]